MVISGKLPNETVWWLSTDGMKIWIESKDLEQEKFKEKGFYIVHDDIYRAKKHVGELTTSRLPSRKYKDAWIIRLDAISDVYPELIDEINRKEIDEKKKKRVYKSRNRVKNVQFRPVKDEIKIENKINIAENNVNNNSIENKIEIEKTKKDEINVPRKDKAPITNYFDASRSYVTWIKGEIDKNTDGSIRIKLKDLKNQMGNEFVNMHDMRIYFGLQKILSDIGMSIELISSKGESIAVIKKTSGN